MTIRKRKGMKEMLKLHDEEEIDKIHMDENYEVQAWCEMFDVSVMDLKQAVETVGTSAIKVKHYLEKRLKIRNQNNHNII
jgi:hypothetical protein